MEVRNIDLEAGLGFAFGSGPDVMTRLPVRLDDATGQIIGGTLLGLIDLHAHGHFYEVVVLLGPGAGPTERHTADLIISSLSFDDLATRSASRLRSEIIRRRTSALNGPMVLR